MPAMWDSFKTGTGPSLHQLPPQELKNRPFLRQTQSSSSNGLPQSRSATSAHSNRTVTSNKSRDDVYESQTHLHDDFENRLNGLGIQNGPFRYEIRRGKTVRTPDISGPPRLSPVLGSDDIRAKAPPRNPRRLEGEDDSPWRPASSIYTNDDGDRRSSRHSRHLQYLKPSNSKAPAKDMYGRGVEISPPSSPEFDARQYGPNSQDVSPIDDSPNLSQLDLLGERRLTPTQAQAQLRSQIPTMRREKPTSPSLPSPLRTTRSSDQLAEASKPWENIQSTTNRTKQPFGSTTIVTGPQHTSSGNPSPTLGQRIRKFARAKPEPLETRPPWNGASGRAPMVDPVRDDPTVAPLSLQRRVSKRVGLGGGRNPETPSDNAGTGRRLLTSRSAQKLNESYKTPSPELVSHPYPSPPNTGSPPPSQPNMSHAAPSMLAPNMVPDQLKAIKRKPSPSTYNPHTSWSSSVYSAMTENTILGEKPLLNSIETSRLSTSEDPWEQPPSRFSVTTCNTAAAKTPVVPDEEERPDTPKQTPSVMDRRRPVPGGDNFRRASNVPIVISMNTSSRSSLRPESIMSTDKELPPAPPEVQSAHDRVAYLSARLDSLAHRRHNINKSIKQMTELMPTDRLLSSTEVMRKREIEKKKVEALKEELAEIQREEHDLGLKLYRANKRAEREAAFEPSSLWVRRVTS
ncbi:hypothetical protein NW752_011883 [Fusarium irregulare]|uniref:Uncharacterized protein n=1 Tax=Fusarium irregulare TaxID=2494466 RepID=A0A9W8U560_9HYPO|nr:hypothetical protein NW766_012364 [Fusarium irregulare]KAJ4004269.1 hypothetical protein NW752_011883 [Fusarium irregulare]